jgi:thiamine-monophosphate kinase
VGGDTTSSLSGLIISVTAVGTVHKERIVYRNTAGENDLVCVSGNLGAAYIGLQLLEREKKVFESGHSIQPELTGWEYVLERQLKPEARRDVIRDLDGSGILPTAMIDLSDGLSSDLLHICRQSGRGCRIYQDKIPIDRETTRLAEEMNIEPFLCAMNGGEDYELLFTVQMADHDKIAGIKDVQIIGHMTPPEEDTKFITSEGNQIVLQAHGWDALQ